MKEEQFNSGQTGNLARNYETWAGEGSGGKVPDPTLENSVPLLDPQSERRELTPTSCRLTSMCTHAPTQKQIQLNKNVIKSKIRTQNLQISHSYLFAKTTGGSYLLSEPMSSRVKDNVRF